MNAFRVCAMVGTLVIEHTLSDGTVTLSELDREQAKMFADQVAVSMKRMEEMNQIASFGELVSRRDRK